MFSWFDKPPSVASILAMIESADEVPSTERIDILKAAICNLAQKAERVVRSQDPRQTRVLALPSITETTAGKGGDEWFVVGDLHGDFRSLCRILLKIYLRPGVDPDRVKIIFLGDYLDRGNRPFELLSLLLNLKVEWPEHYWLLQGNHECFDIGVDGTVQATVRPSDTIDTYREHYGEDTFRALAQLFNSLPVAFLQSLKRQDLGKLNEPQRILYVHGGIPRTENLLLPLEDPQCWSGFIWSDPELEKDEVLNGPSHRFSFGRKDFFTFTNHHNLSLVIRGHEYRRDGFDLHEELLGAERRIVTIFSCGGPDNDDSHYGADILVPRFLHFVPASPRGLPFAVEEVYRDDLYLDGSLRSQNPELFDHLLAGLKAALDQHSGVTFNLKLAFDDSVSPDRSDRYDDDAFCTRLRFMHGPGGGQIGYVIRVGGHSVSGNISPAELATNDGIAHMVERIKSLYPIFGKLPQHYLAERKENRHA